ncbi:MAG: hypothetical protein CL920_02165 [Deltaproteobacteria bacterium]|nr:hypothetical protein [Deltaproteobacteria bacterium]MBU47483.1 hypothetical protein [Deltaproteobacteria bacterium]
MWQDSQWTSKSKNTMSLNEKRPKRKEAAMRRVIWVSVLCALGLLWSQACAPDATKEPTSEQQQETITKEKNKEAPRRERASEPLIESSFDAGEMQRETSTPEEHLTEKHTNLPEEPAQREDIFVEEPSESAVEPPPERPREQMPEHTPRPVCDLYCNNVMTNCTGKHAVFASRTDCLDACRAMPTGTPKDSLVNSAYCRAYHASTPAQMNPASHCPHAAITSNVKVCGQRCESYCDQVMANCTGANAQFSDRKACETWCVGRIDGAWDATQGDSIACRAYYASFPAVRDPAKHCPAAGPAGGGVCVDTRQVACKAYCDNVMANCSSVGKIYSHRIQCEYACRGMPIGNAGDTKGNSIYCRAYHAGAPAKTNPALHCPHASISSNGDVCGTRCEAYCEQVMTNCTGTDQQHQDKAACMAWCKTKPSGAWTDKAADTIACRAYHASFAAASDPKSHCPHAGKSGDNICVSP